MGSSESEDRDVTNLYEKKSLGGSLRKRLKKGSCIKSAVKPKNREMSDCGE